MINVANGEYNKVVPRASGEAEQKIQAAEGYALKRVNEAEGDVVAVQRRVCRIPQGTRSHQATHLYRNHARDHPQARPENHHRR